MKPAGHRAANAEVHFYQVGKIIKQNGGYKGSFHGFKREDRNLLFVEYKVSFILQKQI